MVQRLALLTLQRGVGSMDFVHGMMTRIYDMQEIEEPGEASQELPGEAPQELPREVIPEWCKCRHCYIIPRKLRTSVVDIKIVLHFRGGSESYV